MRSPLFRTLFITTVTAAVLFSFHPLHAQVPAKGTFTATKECPAQRAINGENPGNVMLEVGDRYQAVGFNSARRTHILLVIDGANPNRRWVSVDCGTFEATSTPDPDPGNHPPDPGRRGSVKLFPFFDTQNNPIPVDNDSTPRDISPPPPKLEPFDRKILQLCGNFDAPVSESEFKRVLTYYPDVVRKLKQAANGELKPNRRSDTEFIDDLGAIWFGQKGFKHVFCGELDRGNSIGGLHFYGRYLEFQEQGLAGRVDRLTDGRDAKAEVIDGTVYSFGMVIKQGDRIIAQHPIKGYSYVSNAQEMLIDATRAFKLFRVPDSPESQACLFTVTDLPARPYQAVFVKKGGSIRTFYPDATPDQGSTPACEQGR